ncbi:MAG TPA: R3H domain-containing nucleic acid-binding protein [Candidatus Cloacimonadota bacterium]|nr:R3H domain-containing nucleic acid-binding protein [Candidatus Cloacimonadota bacterium]HPT72010.1 R3H domain-containing nucleic acid-binding protein [Candidatus Cloacimonadota bacterium]
MKDFTRKGNSVQEILREFADEQHVNSHQIKYEVLQEGTPGFLGFLGKKKTTLLIHLSDIQELLSNFTTTLLTKMKTDFDSVLVKKEGDSYLVSVVGSREPGFIIGKEGRMLENLQFLLNRIFEKEAGQDKIYFDVDGYKERQEDKLIRRIKPLIDRARENQQSITLDPMNPAERRIIHKYVENDTQLRTLTVGEGKMKRIVVFPNKGRNPQSSNHPPRTPRAPHARNQTNRYPNRRKRNDETRQDRD